jgi:putative protein-disulfide isomerase
MSAPRVLWYFADPMCSWCWGFSPVISTIKEIYATQMKIALILGGLRPGTIDPMTPKSREEILHHWRDVHEMTGQPFAFEGAMPEGFIYDTEPPSRAVITVAELAPEAIFPYFKSVQEAFYTKQQDVTQAQTLAALAQQQGIDINKFTERFDSSDMKTKTQTHFQVTREAGVRGFPTIVLQNETSGTLLTNGYRPLAELKPKIDDWLAGSP